MTVAWREVWASFGRIGVMSFGGPAAQIAVMQRELVERRGWLDGEGFLRGLAFCTLLPGPEAMQLATYAGWRVRGTLGGLTAGLLFVLPGAVVMMGLAAAYLTYGRLAAVEAAFLGVKAAVLAIVLNALVKLWDKVAGGPLELAIATGAFAALLLGVPFWAVLIAGGLSGLLKGFGDAAAQHPAIRPEAVAGTVRVVITWGLVWWVPLLGVITFAPGTAAAEAAVFFSWLATVSFGGAYAVLAALSQTAVEQYGWLTKAQMIDGLGLAETTPGPLILVTTFTAWLGGAASGGWPMALATAATGLWATFAPCFLFIFAGAPHVERLTAMPKVRGALRGITAAVLGVIAALAVWFGRATIWPDGLDPVALALAVVAGALLLGLRRGLVETLLLCALLALGWHLLGGSVA
ncbi:chromate efflux transporter [Jannaschia sp. Os4]|uniref:chromate efflux transporter n=1 Tax=Jannaschia sp. Os4 TaxID=2807617 RepID=UPI00193A82EC|nr:chromate efflux transporter [Jannaschia sp. Os4]MBM2577806.1 chromate efflux transporter [Jannaschia sp. Os4]